MVVELGLPNSFSADTSEVDLSTWSDGPASRVEIGRSILQAFNLEVRSAHVRQEVGDAVARVLRLTDRLPAGQGILLEVRIYSDGHGPLIAPNGGTVMPIGIAPRPVDCLAEHLEEPQLRPTPPEGLSDVGGFIWVAPAPDNSLRAHAIAAPSKFALWKLGRQERNRLDLLGRFEGPAAGLNATARRAEYWQEIARVNSAAINASGRAARVRALNEAMRAAEIAFSDAQQRFDDAVAEMEARQDELTLGEAVLFLTRMLDVAARSGVLFSRNAEGPVTTGSGSAGDTPDIDRWLEEQIRLRDDARAREEAARRLRDELRRQRERQEREMQEEMRIILG